MLPRIVTSETCPRFTSLRKSENGRDCCGPRLEEVERSTLRQYSNHVRLHIYPLVGNLKLARLSTPMIEAFRDELLKKDSRAMARKVLASLKSILSEGAAARLSGAKLGSASESRCEEARSAQACGLVVGRDIPSKEEIQTIISAADGRWRPLLVTAVFTGMRSSELRGLAWDNVDFDQKLIHVRQREG
jgi:integrase